MIQKSVFFILLILACLSATAAEYYLDANLGIDTGDGSITNPWKSLDKAKEVMQPGDTFYLMDGDYGSFSETAASRSGWITFKAAPGHEPTIRSVSLSYSELSDSYLRFEDINFETETILPACDHIPGCVQPDGSCDPQCPEIGVGSYHGLGPIINLNYARNVIVRSSSLKGFNKYLVEFGANIENCENITIADNEITRTTAGVFISHSEHINLIGNHIHEGVGSCIRYHGGNFNVLIERNHCHDFNWNTNDDYCPRGDGKTPHGSAMSLRSGNLIVRNNIFHDGFTSSGIMFYAPDVGFSEDTRYDNALFENNILYDIHNSYVFRIYNLGTNISFRNNLFVGKYRLMDDSSITSDGRYRFITAFSLHSIAPGVSDASINMHNNIFIGTVYMSSDVNFIEDNNLFWSYAENGWQCDSPGNNSLVMTCSYRSAPDIYETGFFTNEIDFNPSHGKTLSFAYSNESPAINAGNLETSASESIGSLADGFILDNGIARDSLHHSQGPYEIGGCHELSLNQLIQIIEGWRTGSSNINTVMQSIKQWKNGC